MSVAAAHRGAVTVAARRRSPPVVTAATCSRYDFQPETVAWLARLPASPALEQRNRVAVNRVIRRLKEHTAGGATWAKFLRLHLPCDTSAQSLVDIAGAASMTSFGSLGFVEDNGFVGNVAGQGYARTGFTAVVAHQTSFTLGFWCLAINAGGTVDLGCTQSGHLLALRAINSNQAQVWIHSNTVASVPVAKGTGFLSASLIGSTLTVAKGRQQTTFTRASTGLCANELCLLRTGTSGTLSANMIGPWWACYPALTPEELDFLYGVIFDYLVEVDAIEFDDSEQQPNYGANIWTASTINQVVPAGTKISQQSRVPLNNTEAGTDYAYYPVSYGFVANAASSRNSTWTGGKILGLVSARRWQDVSDPTRQLNIRATALVPGVRNTAGRELRQEYSSPALSDVGDRLQAMFLEGYSLAAIAAYARANGYPGAVDTCTTGPVLTWAAAEARKDDATLWTRPALYTGGSWDVSTDVVVLPQYSANDLAVPALWGGIGYDYEKQDGPRKGMAPTPADRTPAMMVAQMSAMAALVKARPNAAFGNRFDVYPNNLLADTQVATFLNADTLPLLHADTNIDSIAIMCAPDGSGRKYDGDMRREIDEQLALFGPSLDKRRVAITLGMGAETQTLTVADAGIVNAELVAADAAGTPYALVHVWPWNGTVGGGSTNPYNQALAAAFQLTLP